MAYAWLRIYVHDKFYGGRKKSSKDKSSRLKNFHESINFLSVDSSVCIDAACVWCEGWTWALNVDGINRKNWKEKGRTNQRITTRYDDDMMMIGIMYENMNNTAPFPRCRRRRLILLSMTNSQTANQFDDIESRHASRLPQMPHVASSPSSSCSVWRQNSVRHSMNGNIHRA